MNTETIIKSLENAENDNKKFALLLILSELIKSGKLNTDEFKNDHSLNKRLFNSIGAHFLARLITTKQQTSENNSPILYKSVGLSILTQFLDYPTLISDPILLTKLDVIIDILINFKDSSVDAQVEQNLRLDIFKYLYALSAHCPDYLILNVDLIDILVKEILLNPKHHQKFQLVFNLEAQPGQDENFLFISSKIINNLCQVNALKEKNKSYFKLKADRITKSLLHFLEEINKNQDEFKFNLINYLNYFLEQEAVSKFFTFDEKTNEQSSNLMFSILNDLFRSKLSTESKELAFILLNNFVKIFQFEFIYMKNRNFFYLIIHLLCIQISLNLENAADELTHNKNKDVTSPSRLSSLMSICYSLLEEVIIILSTASPFDTEDSEGDDSEFGDSDASENDEDDDIEFKKAEKEDKSEPEITNAIKVIVECLQTLICFINDTLIDENSYDKLNDTTILLLVSSIRVIVCWLSHESLLEQEIVELITKKLIKFCEHLKQKNYEINAFEFIVPGLQRVLIDQENKLKSKSAKTVVDPVKIEFEKSELKESIESLSKILETCYLNTKRNLSNL
jgi:hypothetical protein